SPAPRGSRWRRWPRYRTARPAGSRRLRREDGAAAKPLSERDERLAEIDAEPAASRPAETGQVRAMRRLPGCGEPLGHQHLQRVEVVVHAPTMRHGRASGKSIVLMLTISYFFP